MQKFNAFLRRVDFKRLVLGLVAGAVLGYMYYAFVGCSNGTCAITSNPVNATLYGILIGTTLAYREKPGAKKEKN